MKTMNILELHKVVKFIVTNRISAGADFGSFAKVFREYRDLEVALSALLQLSKRVRAPLA